MAKSTRPSNRDHGRFAAGLFAATVVITGGTGACLAIVFLFATSPWQPIAVIGAGLFGLALAMWLLTDPPTSNVGDAQVWIEERRGHGGHLARFRPRRRRTSEPAPGPNKPPTVEDLRQIKQDSNVWCPSDQRVREYRKSLGEGDG